MDNNNLLTLLIAFVLGYFAHQMMGDMCGNRLFEFSSDNDHLKFETTLKNFISDRKQISDILIYNNYKTNLLGIYKTCFNERDNPICTITPPGANKVGGIIDKYFYQVNDRDFKLTNYIIAYIMYSYVYISSTFRLNHKLTDPEDPNIINELNKSITDSEPILIKLRQYIPIDIIKFLPDYHMSI